jgi:DUF2934 family protein
MLEVTQKATTTAQVHTVDNDVPLDVVEREKLIRKRAHQLYVQRGMVSGAEMDDWLQAEFEVREAEMQGNRMTF